MERYKAVLSNTKLYREIELEPEAKAVRIGTGTDCNIRFDRDMFFEDFSFQLENQGDNWLLSSGENNYVSADGILKLSNRELAHGDSLYVKDKVSNIEILTLTFTLDFDYETKDYDRVFDLDGVSVFTIGGVSGCDIELDDPLIGRDLIQIVNRGDKLLLKDNGTQYGIYVNGLRIQDEEEISDYNFFSIIGNSFYFKYGKLYTQKSARMSCDTIPNEIKPESDGRFQYPVFNRNTRVVIPVPTEPVSILDPPAKPEKNKENIIVKLLPTISMVGVMALMANMSGGGVTMLLRTGLMAGVTVVMTIIGLVTDKRDFKRDVENRDTTYRAYISKKKEELIGKRSIEKGILEDTFFSPEKEMQLVGQFSSDLFDRISDDTDFLHIRLGTGPVQSSQPVDYKEQETLEIGDELTLMPAAVANEFCDLPSAPIVVDGKSTSAIGIVGSRPRLYDMLKNILLDLTTRHYYDDVQLFLMTKEELASSIAWARFVPHLFNKQLGIRNFVCDEESKNYLFEYLYKELSYREENKISSPHIVVISYSDAGMKSHPISNYYANASELGITFLFFEEKKHNLPLGCGKIVTLQSGDNTGTVFARDDDTNGMAFSFEAIDEAQAAYFVQKLAPVYCEEVSLESNLTKSITYYEMLDILSVDNLDLNQRWASSEVHKTMAAPLGVNAKNELINLDLHEKFHGPHGLVAGTTGSGKSEILQSYILSCAINFHPYDISFVIIDFKGGGMVDQFKDLPHLNGAITNIDGKEIDRSLKSIKAELKKRQSLFRQAEVNNIGDYIKLYKANKVETPLPHLILVVDEFAELKQDQPEFMKELVSAARIGRSLGVHLILATQKPSGVVDDQIWSNSKFKLCLKVQNAADSNEVLKSPLAAEIREPGRAYLQVGNNEIFELFQSAYSGAPAVTNTDAKKKFKIYSSNLWGQKQLIFEQKSEKTGEDTDTQLSAVVKHVAQYVSEHDIERLPGICLPPMRDNIPFKEAVISKPSATEFIVSLGIYDDPDHQMQQQYSVDLLSGNVFIVGASQCGKTAMLQLILRNLAMQYSPDDVSIYILDFASMALKIFDDLANVGGVVTACEDVKLKTFFRMMSKEIASRKEKLSKLGLASFSSYKEAGHGDLPFVVIMLDNITAFRELYEAYDDEFLNMTREGPAVGVNIIVTTVQTRSLGYKYLSNFANRIALYCNSKDEYGNLFERCRTEPKNTPGRALITMNKEIYEYQNYLPFEGEKEIDRVNSIKSFISEINGQTLTRARRIPEVPDLLTPEYIEKNLDKSGPYTVVAGMDFDTVDVVPINLLKMGYFAISGREKSGKNNFIRYVFSCLDKNNNSGQPVEAVIIDDYERKLESLEQYGFVSKYTTEFDELDAVLAHMDETSSKRLEDIKTKGIVAMNDKPLFVLAIQNAQFFEPNALPKEKAELLKKLLKAAPKVKMIVMFTNLENAPIPYGGNDIQKQLKDTKNVIFFDDLAAFKPFDIPSSDLRNNRKPIDLGDAFFIMERSVARMKTPLLTS